ncbi:MAG: Fur family transcriptional regulator [Puniceicoccaceae bacterium]
MPAAARRKTRQKEAILEALQSADRPLAIDEILDLARQTHPRIGERTVYRNLSEMVEDFRLAKVYYPGQPTRYELPNPRGEHHPHFICRICKQVFVLPDETPSVIDKIAPHPHFVFESEEVILYGNCRLQPDCPHLPTDSSDASP